MALAPDEYRSGGQVFDGEGRRRIVLGGGAGLALGEYRSGGIVVDADGREVVSAASGGVGSGGPSTATVIVVPGEDGVVGNGSANDTAALLALIATIPSGGADFVLRAGTYKVDPNSINFATSKTRVIFEGGASLQCPTVAAGQYVMRISGDSIDVLNPQVVGDPADAGKRGNGIGIQLVGATTGVHAVNIWAPRLFNLEAGVEFGIQGTGSTGDCTVHNADISACQEGIRSKGFVNYIYGGYIRTCNYGIRCTADRPDQQLKVFGCTVLSWGINAVLVERGHGSTFENLWLEQTSSAPGSAMDAIIKIGTSTNAPVNTRFTGRMFVSPGKDATDCEDYVFSLVNQRGTLVEDVMISTNGPKNGGLMDIAVIREEATNTSPALFEKVTIGPSPAPAGWAYGKLMSKAGTGNIVVREIQDFGQSAGVTLTAEPQADYDYTIVKAPSGTYFAVTKDGHIAQAAQDTGVQTGILVTPGVPAGQTASGLKTVWDAIFASGMSYRLRDGIFDFGVNFDLKRKGFDNWTIHGSGIDRTYVINYTTGEQDLEPLSFEDGTNCEVADLTISAGGNGEPSGTSSDGFDFDHGTHCRFRNIKVIAARGYGFVLDGKDLGTTGNINGSTTLNGAIDASQTTITPTSQAQFPPNYGTVSQIPFEVKIDSEYLRVTQIVGTTWTVVRGVRGTTAATHSSGATVQRVFHAEHNIVENCIVDGTQANAPAAPTVAPSGVLRSDIAIGSYQYKVDFVDAYWRSSAPSAASATHTVATDRPRVTIPVGPTGTRARRVYRTQAGPGTTWYLVAIVFNNTTTTVDDDVSDANLTLSGAGNTATSTNSRPYDYGTIANNGFHLLGVEHITFVNPRAINCNQSGMSIQKGGSTAGQPNKKSRFVRVIEGTFHRNGSHGCEIYSSDRCVVSESVATDNAQVGGTAAGFRFTVADAITCDHNTLIAPVAMDTQTSKTQNYGVNVSSASANKNSIVGGQLIGNKTAGTAGALGGTNNDVGTGTVAAATITT